MSKSDEGKSYIGIPWSIKDILYIGTVVASVIFAFVVVQTTVNAHTDQIAQIQQDMKEVNKEFAQKLDRQREEQTDMKMKLTEIGGKIDMLVDRSSRNEGKPAR